MVDLSGLAQRIPPLFEAARARRAAAPKARSAKGAMRMVGHDDPARPTACRLPRAANVTLTLEEEKVVECANQGQPPHGARLAGLQSTVFPERVCGLGRSIIPPHTVKG